MATPSRKRSVLWNHFSELVGEKAKCNICSTIVSIKQKNTSNLKRHMVAKHSFINLKEEGSRLEHSVLQSEFETENIDNPSTSLQPCSSPQPSSSDQKNTESISQIKYIPMKRPQSITSYMKRPVTAIEQKKLDDALISMICTDMQPFTIVEDNGFRNLVSKLNSSYVLPSRHTLSKILLSQKYEEIKLRMKKKMSNVTAVCLTTDCWTSRNTESFMAVTCHFVSESFNFESILLECFHFNEQHTAENLMKELYRVAEEWNIQNKVVAIITDNARNICAAIKLTKWPHLPCLAHTINLIVREGLKEVQSIVQKCKSIVEYFHRSAQANSKLSSTQRLMGFKELKLKNDVVTRWNSTHYMLKRLLETKEPLVSTIAILNPESITPITTTEWLIIKEISEILEPFEEVTVEMSSEKNVSASKTIILARGLQKFVKNYIQTNSVNNTLEPINLARRMLEQMKHRFLSIEKNLLLGECSFIDPRFKKSAFASEFQESAGLVENKITQMAKEMAAKQYNIELEVSSPALCQPKRSKIWDDFQQTVGQKTPQSKRPESAAKAISEMKHYLEEPYISLESNPLEWWKSKCYLYPLLTQVMRKRLCILATSVPSERIFSKTGQIISERRNRLSVNKTKMLVFINANM